MRVALGQINTVIGDFEGNAEKILKAARRSAVEGADLVVFPELCVCGYPPMDLLGYDDFIARNSASLEKIAAELPGDIAVIVGYVDKNSSGSGKALRNAAAVLSGGNIIHIQYKTFFSTHDVSDEARYFEPAEEWKVFNVCGRRAGIAVGEDIWRKGHISPVTKLADQGVELLVVPSASPFYSGKLEIRQTIAADISTRYGIPVVYVNMAGGNDSIIFDGNSFIMTPSGPASAASAFKEDLVIDDPFQFSAGRTAPPRDMQAELAEALAFGLDEYTRRCGFTRVHLGLSGGIDSAVIACIAAEARGPENVTALALPSRYSSAGSLDDARALADSLKIKLEILSIEDIFSSALTTLSGVFEGKDPDVTEENIQARIRGILLMAYSNKFNSLLLETGNKSEIATGYCTLYGDMCGGIAPIGDLFKTGVYRLAHFYNRERTIIPEGILTKAPSAELRPEQKDEDFLPPYPVLDGILAHYLMDNMGPDEITARGYDRRTVVQVLGLAARSEYKRTQAPPVLKVSPRAFGSGRRMPVARFVYEV